MRKYKEIISEVQCHYVIVPAIAAIIAAGASAYSTAQQKKASQRAKRNTANAGALAGGGIDQPGAPTAYRFAGEAAEGAERLSGVLGKSEPATSKEQGQSLGMKDLGTGPETPIPKDFDTGAPDAAIGTETAKITPPPVQQQPAKAQEPAAGGGDLGSYAAIAQSLYQAYEASKAAKPQPGLPAQAGPRTRGRLLSVRPPR
jgi:hypothetical protein